MSIASKRRYVINQLEFEMYEPADGDIIACIQGARGNNLHEKNLFCVLVLDEHGESYLVSMPGKFRRSVWIRKGQFVVVKPIEEGEKVRAEIEQVLDAENILYIREKERWPARFEEEARLLTRDVKRGGTGEKKDEQMIDADMLPPSGSDEEEEETEDDLVEDEENEEAEDGGGEEEEAAEHSEGEESNDEEEPIQTYNPNRNKAPESHARK